jgi:hypothetical protein
MSGMGYTKKVGVGSAPVFQGTAKDIQLAQGGFRLIITGLIVGAIIPAGTPMVFDEALRTATPLSVGVIFENAGGAATNYKVNKGSRLKVGDNFAAVAAGKAYPISAIDTSNAGYDLVTVPTPIGALNVGDFVFASSTTGTNNSSFGGVNSLLYADTVVEEKTSVSAVIRATVYARRVPYSQGLEAALKATSSQIIYSQSR